MTVSELVALLERHGLQVNGWRGGAGKFRDVYVQSGKAAAMAAARDELRAAGLLAKIDRGDNPGHPWHGKAFLAIESFWWDEPRRPRGVIRAACEAKAREVAKLVGMACWDAQSLAVLTPAERAEVRSLWEDMPGNTCWVDAFRRWLEAQPE